MAGRHRTFDEDTVLKQATEIFWTKGYESTTTEDLLAAMHLNKGSLYNAFGSKKSLFQRVVSHYSQQVFSDLDRQIEASDQPMEVVRNLFREVCDPEDPAQHLKGCFFGNAVSELASIDSELEKQAIEKLKTLESLFKKALDKAVDLKQLSNQNTEVRARYLINLWNGINVTRRMYPHRKDLEPILKLSLQILS